MEAFAVAVALLSFAAGTISILTTVYDVGKRRLQAWLTLRAAKEAEFEAAINSADLLVLGGYLYDKVGAFSLHDYASDTKVRGKVEGLIEGIREFVGVPDQEDPKEPPGLPSAPLKATASSEIQDAIQQIESGQIWNGLAQLRRAMELHLRDIAQSHKIPYEHASVGRLLSELVRRELIPRGPSQHLRYAVWIANRGVHGIEVSVEEAHAAIDHAVVGLRGLGISKDQ